MLALVYFPPFSFLGLQVFSDLDLLLHCWHLDRFLLMSYTFILPMSFSFFHFTKFFSFFSLFLLPNNSSLLFFHPVPTMLTACSPSRGPRFGMGHQNHQPEVPQRFLGTPGSCQAGKPWPREGAGGWGCWVALGGPDTAPGSRSRLVFTESSFVIVSPSFLIR